MDLSTIGCRAYLTIDAGGTYLKSAVLSWDGEVANGSFRTIEARSEGSEQEILSSFRETIVKGLRFIEIHGMKLSGIGIAFPGPFNYIRGIPLMEHKFLNIYGVNMKNFFREIPGVLNDIPITFIHDAHAVLSGELWKGNAAGFYDSAVVTLGTGLGFAFSKNGTVQSDSLGGPLVTIFKLPYNGGILEDFTARRGILKIYKELGGNSFEGMDVSDIGKRADRGDKISIQTFGEVGRILATALHNILIERNIQCLLLGGQISRSFRHLEETLRSGLIDVENLQRIIVVKSIDNASFLGALRAVRNYSANLSESV